MDSSGKPRLPGGPPFPSHILPISPLAGTGVTPPVSEQRQGASLHVLHGSLYLLGAETLCATVMERATSPGAPPAADSVSDSLSPDAALGREMESPDTRGEEFSER